MAAKSNPVVSSNQQPPGEGAPNLDDARPQGPIRTIVLGSLAAGLVAALLLIIIPFGPATGSALTGAVLCGFAVGWTLLAVLSARLTDQPQRWAFVPALTMGVSGLLLVVFGAPMQRVLNWLWPLAVLGLAIWMILRIHRGLRSRLTRWLLYPVAAVLVLASVGGGIETVSEAVDGHAHPIAGRLIDVGGHRLHLQCTGSGSPTVVLEPGGGEMSSNLGWIAPAVARRTRVCVYDRAGRGWSETAQTAPHGIQMATDLHTLLHRGHVPGPYLLAGHSFGGLYMQTFAARYPREVAGMVLIDSTAPKAAASTVADRPYVLDRIFALASTAAQLGLARLYAITDSGGLPAPSRDEVHANIATAGNLLSTIDEYADAGDAVQQAASLTDFGDKPLVVLTATSGHGSEVAWTAAQNKMAGLSTNVVHRVIEGASHEALVADQHEAAATTKAILEVVSAVRSSRPVV